MFDFDVSGQEFDEVINEFFLANCYQGPFLFPAVEIASWGSGGYAIAPVTKALPPGDPNKKIEAQNGASRWKEKLPSFEEGSGEEMVEEATKKGSGNDDDKMAILGNNWVQRKSLRRLIQGEWIDDEAVTFWFKLLAQEDNKLCAKDASRKGSAFFTSFFKTSLLNEGASNHQMEGQYSYNRVKNWARKLLRDEEGDIFDTDKIFIPFHEGHVHWICAVVDMKQKTISIFDSMGGSYETYLQHIFRYLQDEHYSKNGKALPHIESWKVMRHSAAENIPSQKNSVDCGVFVCVFAYFLLLDLPFEFNQEHILRARKWMVLSILRGEILPKISPRQEDASNVLQGKNSSKQSQNGNGSSVVFVTPNPKNFVDLTQDGDESA